MSNERDPCNKKHKHGVEDVISVVLAIGISVLSIGLLFSIFKPGDSGGGFIKAEGSIGGSVTVGGLLDKEEDKTDDTTSDTDNTTPDTDTTPDDEPKEEIVEDLSIKLCLSVPSSYDHYAYITRDGVSTFYKMTQIGSDTYSLNIESFNLTDCTVVFCRMIEVYESVDMQNVLAQSETFTLENNKTYNVTFE